YQECAVLRDLDEYTAEVVPALPGLKVDSVFMCFDPVFHIGSKAHVEREFKARLDFSACHNIAVIVHDPDPVLSGLYVQQLYRHAQKGKRPNARFVILKVNLMPFGKRPCAQVIIHLEYKFVRRLEWNIILEQNK